MSQCVPSVLGVGIAFGVNTLDLYTFNYYTKVLLLGTETHFELFLHVVEFVILLYN